MRTLTFKCTTKTVGKILDKLAIVFEVTAFKEAFCSRFLFVNISSKSDFSNWIVQILRWARIAVHCKTHNDKILNCLLAKISKVELL